MKDFAMPENALPNELLESTAARDRTARTEIVRFDESSSDTLQDDVAIEEPLEMQLAYGSREAEQIKSISVTMRTPGHDFELAAGFLMTEGIVDDSNNIVDIAYVSHVPASTVARGEDDPILPYQPERNVVRITLAPDVTVSLANLERNFYTTSSCGICGKASLLALRAVCPARSVNCFQVAAEVLYSLSATLRTAQAVFDKTGGLHAAGLFDDHGFLQAIREDVGRHNAVDKLLGAEFLADRTPLRNRLLFLSGRASFELLQKSLMAGLPMVVSVGAPSSLAVQVAKEFDITLVGFLRHDHFNVYHGANHIFQSHV
jgi:FdhD protein